MKVRIEQSKLGFNCNRNGHFRFSDSVHGGGNEWSLQGDFLGQGRCQVLDNQKRCWWTC